MPGFGNVLKDDEICKTIAYVRSAVGCFPKGASPFGCEEMSGNVWEWTRSLWGEDEDKPKFRYPYAPTDRREELEAPDSIRRVVRGSYFGNGPFLARCASCTDDVPGIRVRGVGFRVVVSSFFSDR